MTNPTRERVSLTGTFAPFGLKVVVKKSFRSLCGG